MRVYRKLLSWRPVTVQEVSTGFDLEYVWPILERIRPLFDAGFGDAEIGEIVRLAETLGLHEEASREYRIRHEGEW